MLPRPPMLSTHVGTPPTVDINQKTKWTNNIRIIRKGDYVVTPKEIEMALGSSC